MSTSRTRLGNVDGPEQAFAADGTSSETILRGLRPVRTLAALTFETGGEVAYNMLEVEQRFTESAASNVPLPSASVMVEETRGEAVRQGDLARRVRT